MKCRFSHFFILKATTILINNFFVLELGLLALDRKERGIGGDFMEIRKAIKRRGDVLVN